LEEEKKTRKKKEEEEIKIIDIDSIKNNVKREV
jgi:hypothetical protein